MPVHTLLKQVPKPYCPVPELSHWKQLMGKGEEMQQENINPQHSVTPQLLFCARMLPARSSWQPDQLDLKMWPSSQK